MAGRTYGLDTVLSMCDLDLGDFTSGQGHDTPLGLGQQLCEYYQDPEWQWEE